MKKTQCISGVLALALIFGLVLSGCPSPTDGEDGGEIDKSALNASITAAKSTKTNVVVSINGTEVPLGTQWVTAGELAAFDEAIAAAELAAHTANSQTTINSAKATLNNAIETFKAAKKPGTADPVNKSALIAKIAEAENAKTGVQVSATGADVAQGTSWVTQVVWNAFDTAIDTAKTVQSTALNQTAVDAAITVLNGAITTFNSAKLNGSKASGFSAEELAALITQANAEKEGVKTSTVNGDDVGPGEYWVSQSALTTLNTAIGNAQAAGDGDRDILYMALSQALTTFNAAKATGSLPDMNGLFNAIRSADSAAEGVVEAASKAQAPMGSRWATAAQWAAFNNSYESALAVASNANASKNVVAAEVTHLNNAVAFFNSAVTSNGPGEQSSAYSAKLNELAGTGVFDGTPSMTLDDYFISIVGSSYAEWKARRGAGYNLYKNEAMTNEYSGGDTVTADTVIFCAHDLKDGKIRGPKIGAITGTITLTNVPAQKPAVYIEVYNDDTGWNPPGSQLDLSDISGSGTVNWSISLHQDDAFTGSITGYFCLWVAAGVSNGGYIIYIEQPKQLNGTTVNVGSLGAFNLAAVHLSGTLNVTYDGNPVPQIRIYATTVEAWLGHLNLKNPGPNAVWELPLPAFSAPSPVFLNIEGYNNAGDILFTRTITVEDVYNTNKPGIAINLGNIDEASQQAGKLHGTVTFTNMPNPAPAVIHMAALYGDDYNGWNQIGDALSSVSLNGTTGSWTLPPLARPIDQQFLDALNTAGAQQVRFELGIQYPQDEEIFWFTSITKTITSGNLAVDLGVVDIPPTLLLSGTFNGSSNGSVIPVVSIFAHSEDYSVQHYIYINPVSVSGTSWKLRIPYLDSPQRIVFQITGLDSGWNSLFYRELTPAQTASVYQSNISGITLDVGNIPLSTLTINNYGTTAVSGVYISTIPVSGSNYATLNDDGYIVASSGGGASPVTLGWYTSQDSGTFHVLIDATLTYRYLNNVTFTNGSAVVDINSATTINPGGGFKQLSANTWFNGSIAGQGEFNVYVIPSVTAGQTYYLWWNDSYNGDGSQSLDVKVSIFDSESNIIYSQQDSAWDSPVQFTPSTGGRPIYIRVEPYGGFDTGTYAIAYNTTGVRP
ncbi:MAG: hypothetical protein LBD48_09365 [Treponema sp.]|jgi:hypothetical protein|nr:hypothetical protein [Treponema sp.]